MASTTTYVGFRRSKSRMNASSINPGQVRIARYCICISMPVIYRAAMHCIFDVER